MTDETRSVCAACDGKGITEVTGTTIAGGVFVDSMTCKTCGGSGKAPSPPKVHGRAYSREERRVIVERILAAWQDAPNLRLGQLLVNATSSESARDIFYVEDEKLVEFVEKFVRMHTGAAE